VDIDLLKTYANAVLTIGGLRALLAIASERAEPIETRAGAHLDELEKTHQAIHRQGIDGVLNPARIGLGLFRSQLQSGAEELLKRFVTVNDILSDGAPGSGEGDETVRAVIDQTTTCQGSESSRNGGSLNVHLVGNILRASHAVGSFEMVDDLEVVLQTRGKPLSCNLSHSFCLVAESLRILQGLVEHESLYLVKWVVEALEAFASPESQPRLKRARERPASMDRVAGLIPELLGSSDG
jgi:hypothetical protein